MSLSWSPTIKGILGERALNIAHIVALRLSNPKLVESAVNLGRSKTSMPDYWGWDPTSVGSGDVGLALFCAYCDECFPNQSWDRIAHFYLTRAVNTLNQFSSHPIGLFGGLGGLGFTVTLLSRDGSRYRHLCANLDNMFFTKLDKFLSSYNHISDIRVTDYDLISGVTGILCYLLSRKNEAVMSVQLNKVLEFLLSLATSKQTTSLMFYVRPEHLNQQQRLQYPNGCINCGMAHGIPGVIAVLALCQINGITTPGLLEVLTSLTQWLLSLQIKDAYGINWPYAVTPAHFQITTKEPSTRIAWCYGIPGIARALYLAGRALNEQTICNLAVSSFEDIAQRPRDLWNMNSPTFCHGLAGLLQVTLRMYNDSASEKLLSFAQDITNEILTFFEPESIIGFQDVEPSGRRVEHPGLLEGASGVALALFSATLPTVPGWDRLFLLS